MAKRKQNAAAKNGKPPILELVFGALGALFAAALLGIIIWHGVSGATSHPDIQLVIDDVDTVSGGLAARFTARNRGGQTASEVEVEGRLGETVSATRFDFIPGGSERTGTLVFPASGPADAIEMRVRGYREP